MKISHLHIVLFLLITPFLYAQDGVVGFELPVRNSLKFNKYIINPAFSFVKEQNKYISFTNKRQWTQFENAPEAYLFSYSGRFKENSGIGIGLFQQNYGVLTTFGGVLNYAQNAVLTRDSNLTFGLNVGFYQSGINEGNVVTNFPDPSLNNLETNSLLTITPGINYGSGSFDFGASVNNVVLYNLNTSEIIQDNPQQNIQAHVMYTGYVISRGFLDRSKFSALVRSALSKETTTVSGLVMLTIPNGVWTQVGYNSLYGASAGLGLNITESIGIEYNFEKSLGDFSEFGNSHEITLAYKFSKSEKKKYNEDYMDEGALIKPVKKTNRIVAKPTNTVVEKPDTNAKAKADAAAQAKLAADAAAKAKAEEDARLKVVADAIAQADAAAKAKKDAAAQAKLTADAKAKADATAKAKAEEDARLKVVADAKAKADAAAKAKAEAQAKLAADSKAKADAAAKAKAEEDARLKVVADAKAKADAEAQAKLAADAKAKADAAAKAKAEEDARLKEVADAKAKSDAAAKAKADAEAKVQTVNPDGSFNKNEISKDSQLESDKLLLQLIETVEVKRQDLKLLKEENDLSEKGIATKPRAFKSITAENMALEALKVDIENLIKSQTLKITDLENRYKERLRIASNPQDSIRMIYLKEIEIITKNRAKTIRAKESLVSELLEINKATEIERNRRIRRALYDNEQDRYNKDQIALNVIRQSTPLSSTPLKESDFDFGEARNTSIQILKDVKNVEKGYYIAIAVHSDVEKRDAFLTKAVAAGQKNINFFYDVNTSKYYIYYEKFDDIDSAQRALQSRGSLPYNGNMSMVKIEN